MNVLYICLQQRKVSEKSEKSLGETYVTESRLLLFYVVQHPSCSGGNRKKWHHRNQYNPQTKLHTTQEIYENLDEHDNQRYSAWHAIAALCGNCSICSQEVH